MIKINRVQNVAVVAEVNNQFDEAKFAHMLEAQDPSGIARHADGKPAIASWYHSYGGGQYCTTIFYSNRKLKSADAGLESATVHTVRVAVGEFHGEKGAWFLTQTLAPEKRAPYVK